MAQAPAQPIAAGAQILKINQDLTGQLLRKHQLEAELKQVNENVNALLNMSAGVVLAQQAAAQAAQPAQPKDPIPLIDDTPLAAAKE